MTISGSRERCAIPAAKGGPCPKFADRDFEGVPVCHVHDPDRKYCAQHPKTLARVLMEIARIQVHGDDQLSMFEIQSPERTLR